MADGDLPTKSANCQREDLLAGSVALIQLPSGQPFRLMIERVMALQARNIWLIGWPGSNLAYHFWHGLGERHVADALI